MTGFVTVKSNSSASLKSNLSVKCNLQQIIKLIYKSQEWEKYSEKPQCRVKVLDY